MIALLFQNAVHPKDGPMHVRKSIIINRSPEDVYRFWHNFESFPSFMPDLESVKLTGKHLLHWKTKPVAGTSAEWDAKVTTEIPNSRIEWTSVEGSDIYNSGYVRFEPATGGRGTIVRVEFDYSMPGGVVSATLSRFFGEEPGHQVMRSLRAAKQILETGGITISEASFAPKHPAQPPADSEVGRPSRVREYGREYPTIAE